MNEPTPERDLRDLAAIARGMVRLTRCPGGRYTPSGCVCAHCGMDYTDVDEGEQPLCGQPLKEDGYTPFDASAAIRIMRESDSKFDEEGA